jgi:hypothetical protein
MIFSWKCEPKHLLEIFNSCFRVIMVCTILVIIYQLIELSYYFLFLVLGWDLLVRSILVLHCPPLLNCCFFDGMLWLMINLSRWLGISCICHYLFLSHFSVLPGAEAGVCLDNPDLVTDKFKFGSSQKYCSTFHMHKSNFFHWRYFQPKCFLWNFACEVLVQLFPAVQEANSLWMEPSVFLQQRDWCALSLDCKLGSP